MLRVYKRGLFLPTFLTGKLNPDFLVLLFVPLNRTSVESPQKQSFSPKIWQADWALATSCSCSHPGGWVYNGCLIDLDRGLCEIYWIGCSQTEIKQTISYWRIGGGNAALKFLGLGPQLNEWVPISRQGWFYFRFREDSKSSSRLKFSPTRIDLDC